MPVGPTLKFMKNVKSNFAVHPQSSYVKVYTLGFSVWIFHDILQYSCKSLIKSLRLNYNSLERYVD